MVITKLIGRTTDFKGKTLWEILGNLKNYGVGRIVVRSMFERYPEPCYIKILKVEPQPDEEGRKVKVLVEKTFRGRTQPIPVNMLSTTYKADYRLIPKDQEAAYCKSTTPTVHVKVIPSKMEFPPLLKEYILRDYARKGLKAPDVLFLNTHFKSSPNKVYIKADENHSEVLPIGLGTDFSKHIYPEQKV